MKLTKEQVMVANGMKERGTSVRQLAKQMGVTEGALRYRLKAQEEPTTDGRAQQDTALDGYEEAVVVIQDRLGDGRLTGEGRPCQARQIYQVRIPAKWTADSGGSGPPVPEEVGRTFRGMRARRRSEATLG